MNLWDYYTVVLVTLTCLHGITLNGKPRKPFTSTDIILTVVLWAPVIVAVAT